MQGLAADLSFVFRSEVERFLAEAPSRKDDDLGFIPVCALSHFVPSSLLAIVSFSFSRLAETWQRCVGVHGFEPHCSVVSDSRPTSVNNSRERAGSKQQDRAASRSSVGCVMVLTTHSEVVSLCLS